MSEVKLGGWATIAEPSELNEFIHVEPSIL